MSEPIRIANCSGFYGDRLSAAAEMVDDGPIDVLTGDWLAELTMLILARTQMKHPSGGYARSFVTQMEQVMGTCLDRGIKVVANAGGLNPAGCADAVGEVARRLGLAPNIAWVGGDNLMGRMAELTAAGALRSFTDPSRPLNVDSALTANAYLGCWGIVEALNAGADIVITGRVTDAAVVCGPAAWHHGWAVDDWDRLAGAVVAGHIIECGTQATGGNYSFFTEIPGWVDGGTPVRLGFPWAEVASDGSSVIGKHDGTGGEVSIGTVTSQLLYEIGGARYLGPDVTARFDTVSLSADGPDRIRVHGVVGEPPPPTTKVALNVVGGFRNGFDVALTGLDIEAKARLAEAAFWEMCPLGPDDFDEVISTVSRTDVVDPSTQDQATAHWRMSFKDADEHKVGRVVSDAMVQTALGSIPGMYAQGGGPTGARPYGVYRPGLIDAALLEHIVHLDGETRSVSGDLAVHAALTSSTRVTAVPADVATPDLSATHPTPSDACHDHSSGYGESREAQPSAGASGDEAVVAAPLGGFVGTRSGDKGGDANLGVFVRRDDQWEWLRESLTEQRLRQLLPEIGELGIARHEFPQLRALNFVISGLLGEGVAASTRPDPQAKALGEWLRARVVEVPMRLLDSGVGGQFAS